MSRGHRRQSYIASDINELVEIRARQRTFHGAYSRTALGSLGYALMILRLFDTRFRKSKLESVFFLLNVPPIFHLSLCTVLVGLLFATLGALLLFTSFTRARHSTHDFADRQEEADTPHQGLASVGQEGGRNYGRPFVTAGWIVIQVTVVVAAVEIGMLILILTQGEL